MRGNRQIGRLSHRVRGPARPRIARYPSLIAHCSALLLLLALPYAHAAGTWTLTGSMGTGRYLITVLTSHGEMM